MINYPKFTTPSSQKLPHNLYVCMQNKNSEPFVQRFKNSSRQFSRTLNQAWDLLSTGFMTAQVKHTHEPGLNSLPFLVLILTHLRMADQSFSNTFPISCVFLHSNSTVHIFLQQWKKVTQLCLMSDPMDYRPSLPGSSIHRLSRQNSGDTQSPGNFPKPRSKLHVSCIAGIPYCLSYQWNSLVSQTHNQRNVFQSIQVSFTLS